MKEIVAPVSANKTNQQLLLMSACLACRPFILLNTFASPNYISASQADKLGMFFGHFSPSDHYWSLSATVLTWLH